MLANLRALLGVLIDIILLRRGPEQLPASPALLATLVVANIILTSLAAVFMPVTFVAALLQATVSAAVLLLWFRSALTFAGKRERFTQLMIALVGVNLLFLPLILPLFAALLPYLGKSDPQNPPPVMLMMIVLGIAAWAFFVQIRIVKATFEWPGFFAFLLLVGEVFAALVIMTLIFGTAPAPA